MSRIASSNTSALERWARRTLAQSDRLLKLADAPAQIEQQPPASRSGADLWLEEARRLGVDTSGLSPDPTQDNLRLGEERTSESIADQWIAQAQKLGADVSGLSHRKAS